MKSWFRYLAGRVEYLAFEWWIMRAGLAWLVWLGTPAGLPLASQPAPTGIAKFVDLTWLADPATPGWLAPSLLAAAVLYALGILPLLSASFLLAMHTSVATLANSQGGGGGSHHTTNILGLVLIGHILGLLYADFRALRRGGFRELVNARLDRWRWVAHVARHGAAAFRRAANRVESAAQELRSTVIFTMLQATAVLYVVSGISKLWRSKGRWLAEVTNIPLQMEKNRLNEYHDTLVMPPETVADRAAAWIAQHPLLAAGFFGGGLFLELFAFLGLWNRRLCALFGAGLILMHVIISDLLNLGFFYNKWVLFLLWVNVPFWMYALARRLRPAHRPHSHD